MEFEEGENFYASDELMEMEKPPDFGVRLEVFFQKDHLDALVEMADSASWGVEELGVTQESFSHGGYRGTLRGLLIHVRNGVEMMRRGYPEDVQAAFDRFRNSIDNLVGEENEREEGEKEGEKEGECHLVIRDPSGLSKVHGAEVSSSGKKWVIQSDFKRTWDENEELDLLDHEYQTIDQEDKLTTPEEIAKLVKASKRIVLISGAGISVESGIPPFREDDEAVWKNFDPRKMDLNRFLKDENGPRDYWAIKHNMIPKIAAATPNPAHLFFAKLHEMGKLHKIITQNIDSLHLISGVPSEKIIELHGHGRSLICSNNGSSPFIPLTFKEGGCDFILNWDEVKKVNYFADIEVPLCPKCNSPLTQETVKFGQPLPVGAFSSSTQVASEADLVFVVGTSLLVKPANTLPGVVLSSGGKLVVVNKGGETRYDEYAAGVVYGAAGEFFGEVEKVLVGL